MFDLSFKKSEFYALFQTHAELDSPHKVVWREVSQKLEAAVTSADDRGVPMPDHTVVFVPFNDQTEAFYFCGVLNSTPVRLLVKLYVPLHPSPHILQGVIIPPFGTVGIDCKRIAQLAKDAHETTATGDVAAVTECESNIDTEVAQYWRISKAELKSIKATIN